MDLLAAARMSSAKIAALMLLLCSLASRMMQCLFSLMVLLRPTPAPAGPALLCGVARAL
jgi:hypothetical protein